MMAFSQAMIKGRVVDAETQEPISEARVQALYLPIEAVTSKGGMFNLQNLPMGDVELKVTCPGYAFVTLKVSLKNQMTTLVIKLSSSEYPTLTPLFKELNLYREKIAVVTDKPYYYPGEIIWMKAFMNYIDWTRKDSLSRVVYVELIDKESQIRARHVLSLDSGRLAGSLLLPDELAPGNYILRAYTRFMYNFGVDHFFYKSIPVVNLSTRVSERSASPLQLAADNFGIKSDRIEYGLREKVNLLFDNLPAGSYTVSVTDAAQVVPIAETNILQGWNFDSDLKKTMPVATNQIVEKGIRFTGQFVTDYNTGKQVVLSIFRKDLSEAMEFTTDEKGWFQVNGLKFYDSLTFFYKAKRGKKESDYFGQVNLEHEKEEPPKLIVPGFWFAVDTVQNAQRMLSDYLAPPEVRLLEEVEVKASRIETTTSGIRGGADNIIKPDRLLNYGNLLLSLQGKVLGLIISCSTIPCAVRFSRVDGTTLSGSTEPLILINDAPISGSAGDALQNIDLSMVERIEISRRINVLYGDQGRNGIIAVYLKQGYDRFTKVTEITPSFELKGFNRPMTFISPDYSNASQESSMSDFRSTLYWNPELLVNSQSERSCTFYTSDMPGKYRVVVQGVTTENKPFYKEHTIIVKD